MSSELLKQVNYDNQLLKQQSRNLKITREDLNEHISTLIKRTKQLNALKNNLTNELRGVTQDVIIHNRTKHAYCIMLKQQIAELQKKLMEQEIILRNRQQQYDLCLKQYDQIMMNVNKMIESVKIYSIQITDCIESQSSMKAMIFDYEKLKRVIEEQRRYFKQITNSEEKSHEQRLKQLQQMRKRLQQQENLSSKHLQFCKIRLGLIKFMEFNSKKMKQYYEYFLRGWFTTHSKVKLGIHILKNCLQLGLLKHNQVLRSYYYKWHHNIFPKETLSNLVQNALINEIDSKNKIKTLNTMIEKINQDQLATLHIYEKAKFLTVVANSSRRKDLFYGWNIWKNKALRKKQVEIHLDSLFEKVILQNDLRWAFKQWRNTTRKTKAIQIGTLMLEQLNTTKQVARVFRKWRLAVSKYEFDKVNQFVYQVKMRNKITSKINYEKRKTKALTTLQMRYSKIILRNYFHKYYRNVRMFRVLSMNKNNLNEREIFSELRAKDKKLKQQVSSQDLIFSLKTFRKFMMNSKILPSFKKWRTTTAYLKMRSEALLPLLFRKQARDKCFVLNEFRQCVQYYQKKQMHQVLTDLNKKMQNINEKSTDFRERLQKCTQELGNLASKKMFLTISESQKYLQRNYLLKAMRIKIRQLYKDYLFTRLSDIIQISFERICFKKIEIVAKSQRKDKILQTRQKAFNIKANRKLVKNCFKGIYQSLKNHKRAFSLLTHTENVMMFYRMAYAWNALINKMEAEKYKNLGKEYNQIIKYTENKQNYLMQLLGRQKKLQEKLNELFLNFIAFEDISQKVRKTRRRNQEAKIAWKKYREGVEDTIYKEKVLDNFNNFLIFKNQTIFWQGLISNKYQKIIMQMQEQLGKLNKKKKALVDKNSKARGDLQKRMNQQQVVHQEIFQNVQFFRKKYLRIMNYYVAKHQKMESIHYVTSIFSVWKREYKGAKKIGLITKTVFNRELLHPSFEIMQQALIKFNKRLHSQQIIAQLLLKKGRKCMKYAMNLWKYGIKHAQCEKFVFLVNQKVDQFQSVKQQCEEKSQLISKQSERNKKLKLMITCFLAIKNNYTQSKNRQWNLVPFDEKWNKILKKKVMTGWKWLMFYKKTKRNYLQFKKEKYERQLKADVFNSLKVYRLEIYQFSQVIDQYLDRIKYDYLKTAYDKIVNIGAYQRDQLNYQRKRAINTLLNKKITQQRLIKRKILAKWHAWLIPKDHYLPNILHDIQIRILRSAMASIKARMYWNQHYAQSIADKVTTKGYSEINNITNGLLKSGLDPDQIKQYLKKRSNKDRTTLQKVTCHMKTWAKKQRVVRAWHSWKQYLVLKQNIRKSLRKVLNLAGGLGKYWNRWRGIDPKFMNTLQKQSRGSMLERYRELGVLLKQYKRDLKDSSQYCDQLKGINSQYMLYHDHGLQLALSTFSRSIRVGLKQGLRIWRQKTRQLKRKQFDDQFQDLSEGIALLSDRKSQVRYRIAVLNEQNRQLKQKCLFGGECGKMLQKMMSQKDVLSINLADKEHNMKLLLEDNLRLKQKLRSAQLHAQSLLRKVQQQKY